MKDDHKIDAQVLAKLLSDLPAGCSVIPNALANLQVFLDGRYIGYIDLWREEVDLHGLAA